MISSSTLHIGNMIRSELIQQGRTISWLADQLGLQRPNCYRILRSPSLQTDLLFSICKILEYDFFSCYSNLLNENV